jgi:hypothetical protein
MSGASMGFRPLPVDHTARLSSFRAIDILLVEHSRNGEKHA